MFYICVKNILTSFTHQLKVEMLLFLKLMAGRVLFDVSRVNTFHSLNRSAPAFDPLNGTELMNRSVIPKRTFEHIENESLKH